MRLIFNLFFLNCLVAICYSQSVYKYPEKFDNYYNFYPEKAKEILLKDATDKNRNAIEWHLISSVYEEQFEFDNNSVYTNWTEYEVYLNKILKKVVPEFAEDKKVEIFISSDVSNNGSSAIFGHIFLNVGLFESIKDEATLAAIIAHEAGHYKLKHQINKDRYRELMFRNKNLDGSMLDGYLKSSQRMEIQADSFAYTKIKELGLNTQNLIDYFQDNSAVYQVYRYDILYKYIIKASKLSNENLDAVRQKNYTPYASHPSDYQRILALKQTQGNCLNCTKKFFVDSALFVKMKKSMLDEKRKKLFETNRYDQCLRSTFKEYLIHPKNLKNLYYIIECIRRTLFVNPKLKQEGFLTQYIQDSELNDYQKSILHKPDYIFYSFEEYETLKNHVFFTGKEKPFNSYEEAFHFFVEEALKLNMNEANFSKALFYHRSQQFDSCNAALKNYLKVENVLYKDFAQNLLVSPKKIVSSNKTLIIYNCSDYTPYMIDYYGQESYQSNYHQTKARIKENQTISNILIRDTFSNKIIFINELYGNKPKLLYENQKIISALNYLYEEDDFEVCRKIKLSKNYMNEMEDISALYKKNLLLFAPEFYNYFKELGIGKLFYINVFNAYKYALNDKEMTNNYNGYYLDFNKQRPYFKKAVRQGNFRYQKTSEICKELNAFLYEE